MSSRGPRLQFRALIEVRGINHYVRVSAERARRLKPSWRKPMPVRIRVNGKPVAAAWRINMMPAGDGGFFLYLHAEIRKQAKVGVGDLVSLAVAFDEDYKSGPADPMPSWFSGPLRQHPHAQRG